MIPRLAAALLGVALLAPVARAQSPGAQARPGRPFEYTVPEVQSAAPAPSPSQHPAAPLVGAQIERLLRAQGLREAGRFDAAHDMLAALLAEAPHHPLVLAEMARLEADRKQWGAIERLARGERVATRDSLLLGQELVTALERLGHARDAAQIALEVWLASPAAGEWVEPALIRLDAADPRA
ncbi:MAG: tetratricopeptide repeat protein, partial [Candidatus Eisenbacteria bacterium]|nr:tetratricopeptide repeat protein [Candidatus Eisenbacteria bacterium]